MTNLLRHLLKRYTIDDYLTDLQTFTYGGSTYPITGVSTSSDREDVAHSFVGYIQSLYKSCGVVYACMEARRQIFAQARFQWSVFAGAKPGPLFGSTELVVLERPWPNGSTGELLSRMIQDADLSGNAYIVREQGRLRRLRPDWTSIILTAPPGEAVESDVAGYWYQPGGLGSKAEGRPYLPEQVAHWCPVPDPEAQYRGMSWLTPVVREISADKSATLHKLKFFEHAATPNLVVSFKESVTEDQFKAFMKAMNEAHTGVHNAYKNLYVGGGADVTVASADFKQLDFKVVQGAGETRVATAARVPAVIVGLSEGLQGSSLNAGNYNSARRSFSEGTLHDLWVGVSASLDTILQRPPTAPRASLWIDKAQIPFLREDAKDIAQIQQMQAAAWRQLVDGGMDSNAAVAFLQTDDLAALLNGHSGLFSVQLQPPSNGQMPAEEETDSEEDAA